MTRRSLACTSRWCGSAGVVVGAAFLAVAPGALADEDLPTTQARWIWSPAEPAAPRNLFTYFRKVVDLPAVPADGTLRFAADSNARIWVNGHLLRRKVTRYHEQHITAEVIDAGPFLRPGRNVVLVLHHNWGDIVTFQRTANVHAGLYVSADWVRSDASWQCMRAPEFREHDRQIIGVIKHARIRYPVIAEGSRVWPGDPHGPDFDDSSWLSATVVENGPWPAVPGDVETPGQREHAVGPLAVLAAGQLEPALPLSEDPLSIAAGIRAARYHPRDRDRHEAERLILGQPITMTCAAGESRYITFDFHRPVHGYPFLKLADATAGVVVDFGYGELARSIYSGEFHVDQTGWLNPEGVVGPGYADRYITRAGSQETEIPDERTARWLTLHVHFREAGRLVIDDLGMVKSQYPIKPIGSFSCGDERIDRIVKLCLIHAEVTMSDTYVDTPGREDGQWIEDARPRAILSARWFGDTRLRDLMIRTLAEGQFENGNLHPFAPSNYPAGPAGYDWSVQWVAMLWDDYQWSGSTRLARQYWPHLCRYWDHTLSLVDEEGIWRTNHVFADIRVGVHCALPRQSSGLVTPWMIERLRWSAELAEALGEGGRAARWRATADRMAEAFRRYHLVPAADGMPAHVGDRFDPEDPQAERGYSQAGQTVAVMAGLLAPQEALATLEYAFPPPDGSPPPGVARWNNPTYGYRVLRALSHAGLEQRAVAHLIERYSPYLPGHLCNPIPLVLQGPYGGPLPEYWISREDLRLKPGQRCPTQPEDETGSHGWGALPLLWMHESLLGVTVTAPGGGRIRIAPATGGLPFVAGHTGTPKGTVWVSWDPQPWRLEISLPPGVTAELILPEPCRGRPVRIAEAAGRVEAREADHYRLEGAGRYVFGP